MISQNNLLDKLKRLQVLIDKTDAQFGDIMLGGEIEETDLFNVVDIELLQEMNDAANLMARLWTEPKASLQSLYDSSLCRWL